MNAILFRSLVVSCLRMQFIWHILSSHLCPNPFLVYGIQWVTPWLHEYKTVNCMTNKVGFPMCSWPSWIYCMPLFPIGNSQDLECWCQGGAKPWSNLCGICLASSRAPQIHSNGISLRWWWSWWEKPKWVCPESSTLEYKQNSGIPILNFWAKLCF